MLTSYNMTAEQTSTYKEKVLGARVPATMYDEVEKIADETNQSKSTFVFLAIKEKLDRIRLAEA